MSSLHDLLASLSLDWATTAGRLYGPAENLFFFYARGLRMLCNELAKKSPAMCLPLEYGEIPSSPYLNDTSELADLFSSLSF